MQLVEERALGPAVVDVGPQPRLECGPRSQLGHPPVGRADQLVHVVTVNGFDHVDALGEMPVQGTYTDASLLGDSLHRRPAALVGEDLACGVDQALVVAPGVRPHRPAGWPLFDVAFLVARHGPRTSTEPTVQKLLAKSSCKPEAPSVY